MENSERQILLTQTLRKSSKVNSLDDNNDIEAGIIASSFIDIDESGKKVSNLIERLKDYNLTEEIINEILIEIGDEFRHILYHIKDMKFYDYLDEL